MNKRKYSNKQWGNQIKTYIFAGGVVTGRYLGMADVKADALPSDIVSRHSKLNMQIINL